MLSYTLHAGKFDGQGDWFEAGIKKVACLLAKPVKTPKGVRFSKYKNDGGRWAFGLGSAFGMECEIIRINLTLVCLPSPLSVQDWHRQLGFFFQTIGSGPHPSTLHPSSSSKLQLKPKTLPFPFHVPWKPVRSSRALIFSSRWILHCDG